MPPWQVLFHVPPWAARVSSRSVPSHRASTGFTVTSADERLMLQGVAAAGAGHTS